MPLKLNSDKKDSKSKVYITGGIKIKLNLIEHTIPDGCYEIYPLPTEKWNDTDLFFPCDGFSLYQVAEQVEPGEFTKIYIAFRSACQKYNAKHELLQSLEKIIRFDSIDKVTELINNSLNLLPYHLHLFRVDSDKYADFIHLIQEIFHFVPDEKIYTTYLKLFKSNDTLHRKIPDYDPLERMGIVRGDRAIILNRSFEDYDKLTTNLRLLYLRESTTPIPSDMGKLNELQRIAVKTALSNSWSVLYGGPGTGKTEVLKFLAHSTGLKYRIDVLCGRIAQTENERIGHARTYHSTIYHPSEENIELLLIEESTQLTTETLAEIAAYAYINNVKHLVFCGDPNQTKSIGVGGIFKILASLPKLPKTELILTHRYDNNAIPCILADFVHGKKIELPEFNMDFSSRGIFRCSPEKCKKDLKDFCSRKVQFMAPTNEIVDQLNARIQNILNFKQLISPGQKIMWTKNVYVGDKLFLANGELSIIKEIKRFYLITDYVNKTTTYMEPHPSISWNAPRYIITDTGKYVNTESVDLKNIVKPAYCQTVHKLQGSEHQIAVLVLDKFIDRELLYTALSRGKQLVIVVTDQDYFKYPESPVSEDVYMQFGYDIFH